MSKNLRVFLLSVLVVILGVSSAFAALPTYRILTVDTGSPADPNVGDGLLDVVDADGKIATNEAGNVVAAYVGNRLLINANGRYTFVDNFNVGNGASGAPVIDDIILDATADHEVSDAIFVVPTPYPKDAPAEGTEGAWRVTWPTQVKDANGVSQNVDNDHRVKFTLDKRNTNSAILITAGLPDINVLANGGTRFAAGCDLVINVPFRVNAAANRAVYTLGQQLKATLIVYDGTTVTFDRDCEIFANGTESVRNSQTGYTTAAAASTYTVRPGGELIIRNTWTLRGSNLTVDVNPGVGVDAKDKPATLTFDLPAKTEHDLRGRDETAGTALVVDGYLKVLADMTLYGRILTTGQYDDTNKQPDVVALPDKHNAIPAPGITVYPAPCTRVGVEDALDTITKTGSGRLILSDSSNFQKPSVPHYVRYIDVLEGALELASKESWNAGGNKTIAFVLAQHPDNDDRTINPKVTVAKGATFEAGELSIEQVYEDNHATPTPIEFNVAGTAIFHDHAIRCGTNEIYPYGNFISFNNGVLINARRTMFNIEETGTLRVVDGALAAGKIAGKGTIEINNTKDAMDKAVLIIAEPLGIYYNLVGTRRLVASVPNINNDNYARSYIDFEGTIKGTHANVGLYVTSLTEEPYSRRIFQKAKVNIENLIIYGPAKLNVNADTNLDGVSNVWLRSNRPGAANYTAAGAVNPYVAYAKLTVGKLNFVPKDRNSEINLNGLKVDGSSSHEDMGSINVLVYDNDAKNGSTAIAWAKENNVINTAPKDYSAWDANAQGANRDTKTVGPRLTANISALQLYANKGTNKDFPTNYVNPSNGIYALRINGTEQPSRIVIDGTTVTGDGLAADVTNKVHQIEITGKSDVRFTGKDGAEYYPVAAKNSILVKQDAKLEIDRGAVVDGHLTFEPSSGKFEPAIASARLDPDGAANHLITDANRAFRFASHFIDIVCPRHSTRPNNLVHELRFLNEYPADEDFISDEGWYDGLRSFINGSAFTNNGRINGPTINDTLDYHLQGFMTNYTAFTTQVGDRNRWDNEAGEYAVTVKGDLTLARDEFEGYSGRGQVFVRAKPDLSAYDSHEFTTIAKRFKVIGAEAGQGGKYTSDFVTPYNRFFLFRIPADTTDTHGVTVENRDELAIVTLEDWYFMRGGEEFGLGDGHDFTIRVPFKIMYRDEEVTIAREVDSNNDVRYVLGIGTNKYQIRGCPVFFTYDEGMASSVENVSDITARTTLASITDNDNKKYVSDDITVNAEFEVVGTDQFIRLIGTSYSGEKPVKLRLALYFVKEDVTTGKVDWLDGVVPAFRELTLIRNGVTPPETGTQFSSAKTEAIDRTDFTVSEDAMVSFKVTGVRKATYETNTAAVDLVGDSYEWNVKAETGTFYMLDSQGKEARVTDLVVVRYDGNYLRRTTTTTDIDEGFTLTFDADGAVVTLPARLLGTTGSLFNAEKGLALKAKRMDSAGEIISVPVMYTLHSEVKAENIVQATPLNSVVTKGGQYGTVVYDIPPADLSGDINNIKLIPYGPYGLPAWLGFSGNGGTISYQLGDLSGVDAGVYNFSVLAYTGENASTSSHKLYTFTVTVLNPIQPHIAPETDVTINVIIGGEAQTSTLTFISGDEAVVTWSIADHTNPAGLLTGTANGNTYVLTARAAADVVAGSYAYVVNANDGEFSRKVTVVVSEPNFAIETVSNGFEDNSPMDAHVYTAIFRISGAQGEEVVWRLTDNTKSSLYSFHSGDLFVVEGVAKVARDADDNDEDQTFRVVATAGNRTVEEPIETTFTVEADETTYTALPPAAGSHAAVDASYVVNFPPNVTAEVDTVFLPSWLEPVLNDDGSVIGIKFSKVAGELANGTQATVRIEATDNSEDLADDDDGSRYYGWEVVYNAEPEKLTLTLTPAALTVAVDAEATSKASVTNALGNVRYTLSKDAALTWVTISGDVVTVSKPTTAGSYTVTVVAQDDRGAASQATQVLTITVTDGPTPPADFSISVSRSSVSFDSPTASAQTVTLSATGASGSVSYTTAVSPATGLTASVSGTTLTLTPSAAGTYVVTVTGTNGTRTATATVNVTVSSGSTPTTFSISASPATVTFTSVSAAAQTVTLSATNASGSVNYTAEVTASSTGSTGLTNGLDLTVSGNTLTIDPLEAGTYTVTITGNTTTQTATTTITVVVTSAVARVGSSGGGCDAGFGALALVLAAPLFLRRRRS